MPSLRLAKVNRVCAHVAHFQHPLLAQVVLDRQVPLLRAWHFEVARDFQREISDGRNAVAAGLICISRSLRRVCGWRGRPVGNKSLQHREARQERIAQHTGGRQRVRIRSTRTI